MPRAIRSQIQLVIFCQFMALFALEMANPFWPMYIKQLAGGSHHLSAWIGAVYFAPIIANMLMAPVWGRFADKLGYKTMILRSCFGLFVCQLCIAFTHSLPLLLLFRICQGMFAGITAASQAYAVHIAPSDWQGKTLGRLQAATAAGTTLGPLVGGFIAHHWHYQANLLFACGLCALITIVVQRYLRPVYALPANEVVTAAHSRRTRSWRVTIVTLFSLVVLGQMAINMADPIFALYVHGALQGNDVIVGVLYASVGFSILVAAPLWGRLFDHLVNRYPHRPSLVFTALALITSAAAIAMLLHSWLTNVYALFAIRLFWGVCLAALIPTFFMLLNRQVQKGQHGALIGWANSARKLGSLVGIVAGTCSAGWLGMSHVFSLISIVYLLATLLLCLLARRHADARWPAVAKL